MSKKQLAIILIAVLLCAGGGVLTAEIVRRGKVTPAVSVVEPAPTPKEETIVISCAGDATLGSDPLFSYGGSFHARFAEEGERHSYFLEAVAPIFKADALTFLNFEGTLTESDARADKTYAFKGPAHYAEILSEGSVEVVSLANNHTYDFGKTGFSDTRAALETHGISYAYGEHTALFSARPGMRAEAVKEGEERKEGAVYIGVAAFSVWYDDAAVRASIRDAISSLREKGADLVFVSCHWGLEGEHYPYEVQKAIGHEAIDAGADGVWGHHPHVLQGIEKYRGKEIVYSMGNFCFGGNHNPSDKDCMIYQLSFQTVDGRLTGEWESRVIPCRISSQNNLNDYRPTPATGDEAERILRRIAEYSAGLEN